MIPRQVDETLNAAVLAVDLETLFKVAADGNGQIEMAQAAVGEIDADEPAICLKSLQEPGADCCDVATQETGGVHKMAAVRQHEIAPPVGLWVVGGFARLFAHDGDRLKIVGHRVAVSRIVVPQLEPHPPAHLFFDELPRESNAGIEATIVADLQDESAF